MAISKRLRYEIFRRDNFTCRYCGRSAPEVVLRPDHVVPVALGGRDDPTNLVTSCDDCNSGKSATPPDANVVAQVADDAVRWARARKAAAEKMLADLDARVAVREQFFEEWNAWEISGSNVDLPAGWEATIDRFVAAGLPVPLLLDCIDVAWSRKLKPDNIFNYLCGVAWNRVRALDEAAAQSVGSGIPDVPLLSPRRSLIEAIADLDGQGTVDELIAEARADGHPEVDLADEVAERFINSLAEDRLTYSMAMWDLRKHLPDDLLRDLVERLAMTDIEEDSPEYFTEMVGLVSADFATQYLRALPEREANDWITCASHVETDGKAILREAARLARQFKKDGHIPRYLCRALGTNGAICPGTKTQTVVFVNCRTCEGECGGHFELCDEHVVKAISGDLSYGDGTRTEVAEVRDYVAPDDPWAF